MIDYLSEGVIESVSQWLINWLANEMTYLLTN